MQKVPTQTAVVSDLLSRPFFKAVPLDILLFPYTNVSFVSCLFKKPADIFLNTRFEAVDKARDIVGNIHGFIHERRQIHRVIERGIGIARMTCGERRIRKPTPLCC